MTAALIGKIVKEEEVKLKLDLPESLHEELLIYTHYVGGKESDIPEVVRKMITYVLDKESKGKQGKNYIQFKDDFKKNMKQNSTIQKIEEDAEQVG